MPKIDIATQMLNQLSYLAELEMMDEYNLSDHNTKNQ